MNEEEVYNKVIRLELARIPEFDAIALEKFKEIYNGYGPDSWPPYLRKIVTWIYRNFRVVAAVHDVEFYFSDGTKEGFDITLEHWKHNSKIALDDKYPAWQWWKKPLKWLAANKLKLSYNVLKAYSYEFYKMSKYE